MTITHLNSSGGTQYEFPCLHGTLLQNVPDYPLIVSQFPGVKGEQHVIDKAKGIDYQVEALFYNYSSHLLLQYDIQTVNSLVGKLTGSFTLTAVGPSTVTINNATFLGFTPTSPAFVDGSDENGWMQYGVLRWRIRNA